jgi:outer membrane lipoprotein-sorting protein
MKLFAISTLAGVSLMLAASFSPETVMQKQAAVLKAAQSLTVTYTARVAGGKSEVKLMYSKPNLLSVDSGDHLLVSDGKVIVDYDKTANTYTEEEVTPELLAKHAQSDDQIGWAAFFTEQVMKNLSNFQGGTSRNIKGQAVTEVTATLAGATPREITFYVDEKLGVPRGYAVKTAKGDLLVMADELTVGAKPIATEKFAFTAPAGAKKAEAPQPAESATYASIQPILQRNCSGCHGGPRAKGGYSVTSYEGVMGGGKVIPGDPDASPLVKYLTGELQPRMPSGRPPLPKDQIEAIKAWIRNGAKE